MPRSVSEMHAEIGAWGGIPATALADGRQPIEIPNRDRNDLAALFGVLGLCRGAEIGTEQGAYAEVLCTRNPGLRLICVDPWQTYPTYREHVTQSKLDDFFAQTQARLAPYGVEFLRLFSVEAAQGVPNGSLDFVYIDANHTLPYVIQDLVAWVPKVRSGGIVAGHDFCRRRPGPYQCHVVEAITAWTQSYHVAPWFVVGEKTAREGHKRDRPRSWFWVQP